MANGETRAPNKLGVESRAVGAMLGLAVGDALGGAVEFQKRGTFTPVTEMTGGGVHRLKPGEWTDDTAMALCLAESLIETKGFEARDQMERYVRWLRQGYLSSTGKFMDVGITIGRALSSFEQTGNPFSGPTGEDTAGNGSLMRLAPVALWFAQEPARAIEMAGESSRTTNGAPQAVSACRYFAGLLVGALNGVSKDELLADDYSPVTGSWASEPLHPVIAAIAKGSFKTRTVEQLPASGYVAHTLEAALWAFATTGSFETGVLKAVNLGGDADTTGAVFGQIGGAYYGVDAIPERWRNPIVKRDQIEQYAIRLVRQT